jgi:hypothetical protein
MTDAVAAYEEKARDLWLFDYPAQVSSTKKSHFKRVAQGLD